MAHAAAPRLPTFGSDRVGATTPQSPPISLSLPSSILGLRPAPAPPPLSLLPSLHPYSTSRLPPLYFPLSLLLASRFSASFQAGFKQLCGASKCPSLCGLFRKADNDKPNPADLPPIAAFRQPSAVIPRTNLSTHPPPHLPNFPTSGCAASIAGRPCFATRARDFLLLMLISISATGVLLHPTPQSLHHPSTVSHLSSWLRVALFFSIHSSPLTGHKETCAPRQALTKGRGPASQTDLAESQEGNGG